MFRYKSNKQAFIMTALVILLCLSCLTGATLALFTSDVSDGTIGIVTTAGDVKVDIVDAQTGDSLVGKVLQFQTTSEQKEILFEPGATFYTQEFQIKNTGTVPVNYTLSVSKDERIDMEEFDKAFEVYIVRADDEDYKNAELIPKFKGSLGVGDSSERYRLVVKMKETVGNEFQGKTYTGIGVTAYAVQGNVTID